MQPEIDAQLSTFFEETSPPREFAKVMRGYDQHQVDQAIQKLETEARQYREQTQALQRELGDAHRQLREQERGPSVLDTRHRAVISVSRELPYSVTAGTVIQVASAPVSYTHLTLPTTPYV